MSENAKRLEGWKSIAGHFRRDRSTVLRWAASGDMPIHRGPGGRGASVWAYGHELDAWLKGSAAIPNTMPETEQPSSLVRKASIGILVGAGLLAAVTVALALFIFRSTAGATGDRRILPSDPRVAEIYLQGRDDWAARTPASLEKARAEFGEVISRDPSFAAAYAGLADVYIVAREFEAMPDAVAYPKAEAAAKAGLMLDPGSAEANRALGFIAFWRNRDEKSARVYFERALRRDPNDAQTHFWYGNILIAAVDAKDGLRELRIARRLDPGSKAMEVNYAMMVWYLDPTDQSFAALRDIAAREPASSAAHRYLSWAYLVRGDMRSYLDEREKYAATEANPVLAARVAAERAAFRDGGQAGLLNLIASPPSGGDAYALQLLWPATAAAMLGRRDRLLQLMARAEAHHDIWDPWRPDQPRFVKWRRDTEVLEGLKRLHALPA